MNKHFEYSVSAPSKISREWSSRADLFERAQGWPGARNSLSKKWEDARYRKASSYKHEAQASGSGNRRNPLAGASCLYHFRMKTKCDGPAKGRGGAKMIVGGASLFVRLLFVFFILASSIASASDIQILPAEATLNGPEGRQRVSVVTVRDGYPSSMVAIDQLKITSSDTDVVKLNNGIATAVGNGTATLIAKTNDGRAAKSTITVTGCDKPHRWSFRNDVQSVISRLGCNTGACHGALAGKGGFRLSLGAYNTGGDFQAIAHEVRGRRIELADPGRSLLLAKPTGALPHKGGLRLDVDSRDYQILSQWIASGAEPPQDDDANLQSISVIPESALLDVGDHSQVLVNAHYDDGRVVDVTHWARFTSTDQAISTVDDDGQVEVIGSGEGAVLVWFGSKVALARMTVPYPNKVPPEIYADAPRRSFIDEINLAQLELLRLRPSPPCDDEAYLRRSTLDCIGRLPTAAEREVYLAESPERRRDQHIERLLASEDFIDYWTYQWSDVFLINGTRLRPVAVKTYYEWLQSCVRDNKPWDELVREVLTATGESDENGATNFYALHQSPEDMTENACQAFLGLSIGCAKCHNHPLEKWTNDQYYSMANLFARVRAKGWGGDGRNGDGLRTLYVAKSGELIQPNIGKPQPPAPLDSQPLDFDDPSDRRVRLADWLTDPENPYFARAITNRVWANFFGRGLVEQVDDLRLSNPASSEPMLAAASDFVVRSGFDLKPLMRAIMRSGTYQRSSKPLADNREESKYHSRYYPRRLMAEVLLDSIDQVLGTSTEFNELAFPGADRQKTDFYAPGTRAIELYDSSVNSYFLSTFGRNPRMITCDCERSDDPSMVQVLHLSNGETLNPKLSSKNCKVKRLMDHADNEEIVRSIFVSALTRQPTGKELKDMLAVIAEYGDDRETALQDAAWSILTSTEFTFNH